jgi:hypothetical protein
MSMALGPETKFPQVLRDFRIVNLGSYANSLIESDLLHPSPDTLNSANKTLSYAAFNNMKSFATTVIMNLRFSSNMS